MTGAPDSRAVNKMGKKLVLLDSKSDLPILPGGVKEAEYIFICSSLVTQMELEKMGLETYCWDDFLDPDAADDAQSRVYDIFKSWYLSGGKDATRFRESSLGDLAGSLPLFFLVPCFRRIVAFREILDGFQPGSVAALCPENDYRLRILLALCGSRGISLEHRSTPQRLAEPHTPRIHTRIKQPAWRRATLNTATAFFTHTPVSKLFPDRKHIYIIDSGTNRFLWRHWLDDKRLMKNVALGFVKQFPPGKFTLPALLRGGPVLDAFRHRLSQAETGAIRLIDETFERMLNSKEWHEKFRFNGDDCSRVFTESFRLLIKESFSKIAAMLLSYREQLREGEDAAVVVSNDILPHSITLLKVAGEKNIPTFFLEHGILPNYSHRDNLLRSMDRANHLLVWGKVQKEKFDENKSNPNLHIITVGTPPEKTPPPLKQEEGACPLVMGFSRTNANVGMRLTEEENFFLNITKMLKRLKEKKVVVKLHPVVSRLETYERMKNFLPDGIDVELAQSGDISRYMGSAKYIIGLPTTIALTAASMNRRFFCIHLDPYPPAPPFDGAFGPVARSYAELETNIRRKKHLSKEKLLDGFTLPGEKHATAENIFRAILDPVNRK